MDGGVVLNDPRQRPLPEQSWDLVVRLAERFRRAQDAHEPWARTAKQCVEFFEGKQWSASDLQKLAEEGRPALTINKLKPLVNLVYGYHLNNQTETKFLPGHDGTGVADMARVLTALSKQIGEMNKLPYLDAEVFLDGILGGRGFYDIRMDFSRNLFGHATYSAVDPFTVYLDPEAMDYDLNSGNYTAVSRWVSPEEIEFFYGQQAANLVRPLMSGMQFSSFPSSIYEGHEEISPWRRFGGDEDGAMSWRHLTDQFYNWVDPYRKTIRMLDFQHYVRTWRWHFIDLDTGDQKPVPDNWSPDQVQRSLMWAQQNGVHMTVQNKAVRRLRWTHMVGDVIVFDRWSPYETMTLVPFFPYFRRGQTMGMVEDLLDPQREINVRRSARQNIIGRASNGGWMFSEGALSAEEEENLRVNGGKAGFVLKYKTQGPEGTTLAAPQQIGPGQSPVSVEQLEKEAEADLKEIAGINEASLGQIDKANVSGRAILARQRQTVMGLEGFLSNYHRTKELCGEKELQIIQTFYTERRIVRTIGVGSTPIEVIINEKTASGIVNDVTLGSYAVEVDDQTLSDSFLEGQFNELLELKAQGMPIPDDFLIDASSVGRKEELRIALAQARQAMAAQGVAPPDQGGPKPPGPGPGGSQVGRDGGSLPNEPPQPAPPGAP